MSNAENATFLPDNYYRIWARIEQAIFDLTSDLPEHAEELLRSIGHVPFSADKIDRILARTTAHLSSSGVPASCAEDGVSNDDAQALPESGLDFWLLSERERQVLALFRLGRTLDEIARDLGMPKEEVTAAYQNGAKSISSVLRQLAQGQGNPPDLSRLASDIAKRRDDVE